MSFEIDMYRISAQATATDIDAARDAEMASQGPTSEQQSLREALVTELTQRFGLERFKPSMRGPELLPLFGGVVLRGIALRGFVQVNIWYDSLTIGLQHGHNAEEAKLFERLWELLQCVHDRTGWQAVDETGHVVDLTQDHDRVYRLFHPLQVPQRWKAFLQKFR